VLATKNLAVCPIATALLAGCVVITGVPTFTCGSALLDERCDVVPHPEHSSTIRTRIEGPVSISIPVLLCFLFVSMFEAYAPSMFATPVQKDRFGTELPGSGY